MFDIFDLPSLPTSFTHIDTDVDTNVGCEAISELMRAMILRTIEDYNSGERLRLKAIDYMSKDDEDYILSFRAICKHFRMDPSKTRQAIMFAERRISTRRRTL